MTCFFDEYNTSRHEETELYTTLKQIKSYTTKAPSPNAKSYVTIGITEEPIIKYTKCVKWKKQGTKSVTWSDYVEVFDISARKTHTGFLRQGTKCVTWNEYIEIIYISNREIHVEPQGKRKGTKTVTWYTYVKKNFV